MKRLLITGSSGLLGSYFSFAIGEKYDTYGVSRTAISPYIKNQFAIDLSSSEETMSAIDAIKPDIIIHCAAISNVDLCETNYLAARKSNIQSTENLIKNVFSDSRFIYISTDSVFDGTKGNYSEEDSVSPLNNYAKSKLESEQLVKENSKNYIIIRTNFFGWNKFKGESFAQWIVNSLTQRKKINMFTDVFFSPVYALTLVKFVENLINSGFSGILNIATDDYVSKYEFGTKLAKEMKLDTNLINPISIDDFDFIAKRPKNTSLDTSKVKSIFGSMPTIDEEINKFCRESISINKVHK